MQYAFIGGILIAIACGLIGPFLVLRKLSLVGDGLSHVAFAGVAIGLFFGFNPIISALITVLIGSLLLRYMLKRNLYGDAAIAILLSLGVGIGIILLGIRQGFTVDIFSYLIGSILSLALFDLYLIFFLVAMICLFLLFTYKKLVFLTFQEELAMIRFKHLELIQILFFLLVACVVILSIRAVGILLVTAFIVLPTLIALRVSTSFKQLLFISVFVNVFSMILGLLLSYFIDFPPSGTIVLCLFLLFSIVLVFQRK